MKAGHRVYNSMSKVSYVSSLDPLTVIDDPNPENWKQLQFGVCRIFNELGLEAEIEKKVKTPRGEVEVDVFAVDTESLDHITYVIECKNWRSAIPQTTVHSLTTVMHEIGANIGYLISRQGLQSGAISYLQSTNIRALTYLEFQQHYLSPWISRYFLPVIGTAVDDLLQYVEPINSYRERRVLALSPDKAIQFRQMVDDHYDFGMAIALFRYAQYAPDLLPASAPSLSQMIQGLNHIAPAPFHFGAASLRELIDELKTCLTTVTLKFDTIFGEAIFEQTRLRK